MLKKLLTSQSLNEAAESIIFYIFIVTLPFQTRMVLKIWGNSFNEWNSAFLYGTDILVLTLFIFWLIRLVLIKEQIRFSSTDKILFIFLVVTVFSISQAGNKFLSFYSWLKLLEMVGLYFYVKNNVGHTFNITRLAQVVLLSGFIQSIIAILQIFFQRSLGLKILGESVLRSNFSGVAVVPTVGEKFLRAYGTLPHPNILACWIFIAIFAFYFWYLYNVTSPSRWTVFVVYPILLWALFSTFSRVAISLLIMGIILRLLAILINRKRYALSQILKRRLLLLFAPTIITVILFGFFYWPQVQSRIFISKQEQAVSQRILYTKLAGEMILKKPWLGVGLGQQVNAMLVSFKNYPEYFYQPVHNIYLLMFSEVGLFGSVVFLIWLAALIYEYKRTTGFSKLFHLSFFIIFLSILTMGLFDHFFWTLQQGQFIFWLTLGLISAAGAQSIKVIY